MVDLYHLTMPGPEKWEIDHMMHKHSNVLIINIQEFIG